jgi:hypothetical protein
MLSDPRWCWAISASGLPSESTQLPVPEKLATPREMNSRPLITYLNDHLAGSVAAVQLLEHLLERGPGTASRQLQGIRNEIEEDQRVLQGILKDLGGKESPLRKAAAWLTEQVGQAKLRLDDPGDGDLRRFEALEALGLGIQGKASLWRALASVQARTPELQRIDFLRLERRAQDQFERVERLRLNAAQSALNGA